MKTKQINKIEWKDIALGDVALVDSGQGAPQGEKYYRGSSIFVRAGDLNNLTDSIFVGDFCERITKEAVEKYKLKIYKKNSIVFPKSGMSAKTGNIALLKYDSHVTNHLAIVEPLDNISNLFLFFLLKKVDTSKLIQSDSYPSIKLVDIKRLKIPLPFLKGKPDLEAQKKIVSILEKAETLKEKRKRALAYLDEYVKSVFDEMFVGKDFEKLSFAEAGELARGKSKHRPRNAPELLGGKYPLVQTGDIANTSTYLSDYSHTYSELGLKQSKLWPKGTLCITIAANIANTAILDIDACFPDSVVGFTPNKKFKTEYVLFWINSIKKEIESSATQVAQKNINLKILSQLKIPMPSIELQKKFASIVEKVEILKEKQKRSLNEIEQLNSTLMQRAFRGELT